MTLTGAVTFPGGKVRHEPWCSRARLGEGTRQSFGEEGRAGKGREGGTWEKPRIPVRACAQQGLSMAQLRPTMPWRDGFCPCCIPNTWGGWSRAVLLSPARWEPAALAQDEPETLHRSLCMNNLHSQRDLALKRPLKSACECW